MRAPLVSFVVLNWRNEASTRGCIETILRQRRDVEKEIVVVDNESTAETRARLAGGRWRLIALDENRGFTGGMNAGAAATRGSFVALLNNDLRLADDWLDRGLEAMSDDGVGIVGGRSGHTIPRVDPDAGFTQLLDVEVRRGQVASVDGSHLLIRRAAWEELGGLDDDFFAYYEEADLCARALAAGWGVFYEPAMRVWHKRGMSSDRIPVRRSYLAKRNRLIWIAKHFPRGRWRRMTASAVAEYLGGAIRPRADRAERLAGLWAAAWWATHQRWLGAKRRRAIAAGQHDEAYVERLRRLYTPPPVAAALLAPAPER